MGEWASKERSRTGRVANWLQLATHAREYTHMRVHTHTHTPLPSSCHVQAGERFARVEQLYSCQLTGPRGGGGEVCFSLSYLNMLKPQEGSSALASQLPALMWLRDEGQMLPFLSVADWEIDGSRPFPGTLQNIPVTPV